MGTQEDKSKRLKSRNTLWNWPTIRHRSCNSISASGDSEGYRPQFAAGMQSAVPLCQHLWIENMQVPINVQ